MKSVLSVVHTVVRTFVRLVIPSPQIRPIREICGTFRPSPLLVFGRLWIHSIGGFPGHRIHFFSRTSRSKPQFLDNPEKIGPVPFGLLSSDRSTVPDDSDHLECGAAGSALVS